MRFTACSSRILPACSTPSETCSELSRTAPWSSPSSSTERRCSAGGGSDRDAYGTRSTRTGRVMGYAAGRMQHARRRDSRTGGGGAGGFLVLLLPPWPSSLFSQHAPAFAAEDFGPPPGPPEHDICA